MRLKKYNEFITESTSLKDKLLSYANEIEMDYDPEETENFREILGDYGDDLKGLNKTDFTLLQRLIDDTELNNELEDAYEGDESSFSSNPFESYGIGVGKYSVLEEWEKVDLDEYNTPEKIEKWVERVLTNADDWDEAQRDLVEYVTDSLYDDEIRLMWTDVIQRF